MSKKVDTGDRVVALLLWFMAAFLVYMIGIAIHRTVTVPADPAPIWAWILMVLAALGVAAGTWQGLKFWRGTFWE